MRRPKKRTPQIGKLCVSLKDGKGKKGGREEKQLNRGKKSAGRKTDYSKKMVQF